MKGSPTKSTYVTQLKRRLQFAHKKARQVASRQQARHKGLYDQSAGGTELEVGDLVLVRQTVWQGKHKIQDRWKSDEYQVIGQPMLPNTSIFINCMLYMGLLGLLDLQQCAIIALYHF